MIVRNGKTPIGWRLDEVGEESLGGRGFLENPFAIVPKEENAERIKRAFELLAEWRRTPFFDSREAWERWVDDFGARVDRVLGCR